MSQSDKFIKLKYNEESNILTGKPGCKTTKSLKQLEHSELYVIYSEDTKRQRVIDSVVNSFSKIELND